MSRIEILPTKGEYPSRGNGQGKDFAKCAINTKFWHGLLQPYDCPTLHCKSKSGNTIKFMYHGKQCECLSFDTHIDMAECYSDLVFWTGEEYPKFSSKYFICDKVSCRLGVPQPQEKPIASGSSPQKCSSVIYRYVNSFGHVGAPSPPSDIGGSVISRVETPPAEYCISKVEIFVLISGTRTGLEKTTSNTSGFMSAGIYPIMSTIRFDITSVGLEIDSMTYFEPPQNLQGITCHDYGLVGFEETRIWFTEANIVNAWSGKMCIGEKIKCIEYWNKSLFIFTDQWVFRMNLIKTDSGYTFSEPFKYGDKPFPIIGRTSKGQSGIFFASIMGGAVVNNDTIKIITSKFSKKEWLSLCHDCDSSYSAIFDYGVGIFTKKASYILEFGDGSFLEPSGELYQLPFVADYASIDHNGILNYSVKNKWYKWDNCYTCQKPCDPCPETPDKCKYKWESYNYIFDTSTRLTAGFIEFIEGTGDINLKIYNSGCGDEIIFDRTFNESTEQCRNSLCFRKYFRLKGCKIDRQIKINLAGTGHTRRVVLATSRKALGRK